MNRASHWSLWSWATWFCIALGFLRCSDAQTTTPVEIPIFPKYIVLGVVYAPPGSSSSVTYGSSTMVGSSDSISTGVSTSDSTTTVTKIGGGFLGFGATITNTTSNGWESSFTNGTTASIQTTAGNAISTLGPISSSLGVNHDNDVIYIWLNPVVTAQASLLPDGNFLGSSTWDNLLSNGCDVVGATPPSLVQRMYGCDPNQYPYPDIVGIPVWCLKNPYFPGQGCAQWLPYTSRSWDKSYRGPAVPGQSGAYPENPRNPVGLTLEDYADILKADPYVQLNGASSNACHPLYGPNLDPNTAEGILFPPTTAGVVSSLVTSGGAGYGSTPAVAFASVDGFGSGAAGTANLYSGSVVSITMTSSGSGYTQPPTISFSGGSPTTAATASAYLPRLPNSCGGAPSTITNLIRFQPYGTVQYPVPGPNGLPSTYNGTFQYQNTNQTESSSTDTHTTGSSIGVTAGFGVSFDLLGVIGAASFDASFGVTTSQSMTVKQTSAQATSNQLTSSAAYSITGPQLSDNYSGPATYNVYLDNIYHTFAFYSDLEPKVSLGTITISPGVGAIVANGAPNAPIASFPATAVGSSTPTIVPITVTNNSGYPLTMVWPAVTFSTGDFQLVENDANHLDGCSNQYLAPYGTSTSLGQTYYCTLYIEFTPQSGWNPTIHPTPAVLATMIAAGTENANSYQNILVTSEEDVSGIVSTGQGATLIASGQTLTQENPAPNLYIFAANVPVGSTSSISYVFTNRSSTGSITPTAISFSDSTNFTVLPTGTCALGNAVAASGGNCTFNIQFRPTIAGSLSSLITVSGTSSGASGTSILATAAAAGGSGSPITIASPNGTVVESDITIYTDQSLYHNTDPITLIVTNTSPLAMAFSWTNSSSGSVPPILSSTTCGSSLASGGSCGFTYSPAESGGNDTGEYILTVTGVANGITYKQTAVAQNIDTYTVTGTCFHCSNVIILPPQAAAQTQTITAGSTAQYPFSVAPTGKAYPDVVSFVATGLPAGATATFSPATLAANSGAQTVTLSIKTAAKLASVRAQALGLRSPITLAVMLLPLGAVRRIRKLRRGLLRLISLIGLFAALLGGGVTGCGTDKAVGPSAPQSYTIVVTATSGSVSQSANVYLTIE